MLTYVMPLTVLMKYNIAGYQMVQLWLKMLGCFINPLNLLVKSLLRLSCKLTEEKSVAYYDFILKDINKNQCGTISAFIITYVVDKWSPLTRQGWQSIIYYNC